ncbi:hypothetical protein [Vibrio hepatarius]|uniref:hypothetical protein n=1 Tax=Vibrio hepatarius TaxID=171383 RepID=UPI001C09EC81|nr:hypothetical protein [Vibrio hepatarius]MBU2899118.1 hypothetical protein [Vibrio hepatarius]
MKKNIYYEQDVNSLNILFESVPISSFRNMVMELPNKLSVDFKPYVVFYVFLKHNPQLYPFKDKELTRLWKLFIINAKKIEDLMENNIYGDNFHSLLKFSSGPTFFNAYVIDDCGDFMVLNKSFLSEEKVALVENKVSKTVKDFSFHYSALVNYLNNKFYNIKWQ